MMTPPANPLKPRTIREEGWNAAYCGRGEQACPYTDASKREPWLYGHRSAMEWFANE